MGHIVLCVYEQLWPFYGALHAMSVYARVLILACSAVWWCFWPVRVLTQTHPPCLVFEQGWLTSHTSETCHSPSRALLVDRWGMFAKVERLSVPLATPQGHAAHASVM